MKRPASGFTLIELLIGLTLLGFILSLLLAGFRLAAQSWDSVEQKMDRNAQEQAVRQFLRQLLTQTRIRHWAGSANRQMAFFGTPGQIRSISSLPPQFEGGGPQIVGLDVIKHQGQATLSFRRAYLGPNIRDFSILDAQEDQRILIEGAGGISFDYYGAEKPGTQPGWHDRWESRDAMPQLVRIRIDAGTGTPWPDLVIPIFLVDIDALCPVNVFPVPPHCVG